MRAVIVVGSPLLLIFRIFERGTYTAAASTIASYLKKETRATDIRIIEKERLSKDEFANALRSSICDETEAPLLLVYVGHGVDEGWGIDKKTLLGYESIAELLRYRRGPSLLVNMSCHAFSAAQVFEVKRVPEDRIGIIALCGADREALLDEIPSFVDNLIDTSWRHRESFPKELWIPNPIGGRAITGIALRKREDKRAFIAHHLTRIAHFFAPEYIITRRKISLVFQRKFRTVPEILAGIVWGANLDHYFFPTDC